MTDADRAWNEKHPRLRKLGIAVIIGLTAVPAILVLRLLFTAVWAYQG